MNIHIKSGRLVDPKNGVDEVRDLFIAEGFAPVPRDPKTGLPPDPDKGGSTKR